MSADFLIQVANKDGAQYAWLRQSLNDFEMAKILLVANKWDGVCYHAQQAVEKLLKFMLSDAGQAYRHTHSVHELAKDCNKVLETAVFDDDVIDLYKELSQYNTIARYPSSCDAPVDVITKKQALSAMDTLNQTLLILEKIYESN
ncbi:MAG: HEPN domain-containing protein [Methylococcaceae bacterium]